MCATFEHSTDIATLYTYNFYWARAEDKYLWNTTVIVGGFHLAIIAVLIKL
jgi:hypothetical protein